MYASIKEEMDLPAGTEVCVLVNGLGSTTLLELSIAYRRLAKLLEQDGIQVYDSDIQSYCTCQEMGGFSISIMKIDEELKAYYNKPCFSPYFTRKEI